MKISELNTDRALDVLCEVTPHINNIATDEAIVSAVGEIVKIEDDTNKYGLLLIGLGRISQIVPMLLKTHRPDVYGILSTINEKDVSEIAAQPIADTVRQAREVFQDPELLSFFKSFGAPEKSEQPA